MCCTIIKHHRLRRMRKEKEDNIFFKNETDNIQQYPLWTRTII